MNKRFNNEYREPKMVELKFDDGNSYSIFE